MNFACSLKISILLAMYESELTEWESTFISALRNKSEFTAKQRNKIDEVWKTIRLGKRDLYREPMEAEHGPYSHSLGVSYDDVHDFDK